jgi:alpha-tubulin suppressor-like RCC1 family protein
MSDCNYELICWEPNDIITETPISARNYVAWGYNVYGQLGNNTTQNIEIPEKFKFIGIKQISCGYYHTAILLTNGHVYTCGLNESGQLGRPGNSGDSIANSEFMIINLNVGKVKQISCGGEHTAILLTNGHVYTCGLNFFGQLGRPGNGYNNTPNSEFMIINLNVGKVKQISCGYYHTAILLTNGHVYTCGNNQYGQLGRPLNSGTNKPNPEFMIINLNVGKVKQISCGYYHTAILLTNGYVYTCGNNYFGELGRSENSVTNKPNPKFEIIDPYVGKVKQISCGGDHTAILLTNGHVYTCGYNEYGQLGRPLNSGTNKPNPKFEQIDKTKIKNIKFFLLSIGCTSNSVLALPY